MIAVKGAKTFLVVGRESVGKSQLISTLSGSHAGEANFRGSTVCVERYAWQDRILIDTPGIHRKSDTDTTRRALESLNGEDAIILVVQATSLDEDLQEMLPLVQGKNGLVIVTFWDKVQPGKTALEVIERLSKGTGVDFIVVNARSISDATRRRVELALNEPREFIASRLTTRTGWRIEPRPGLLEHRFFGPIIAACLLVLPALATIFIANAAAGLLHPAVDSCVQPLIAMVDTYLPSWIAFLFTGKIQDFGYGLLNMGPFLIVWALPTVLLFALILAVYKSTGLVERVNAALHPWARPFGLSGRDIVRVVMGFGCNVPAVISTRACSGCSRNTAISAIAFGAACSYQLPATLAVLAAASRVNGVNPIIMPLAFLGYLLLTTLVYLRLTAPRNARAELNVLMQPRRPFLQWPTASALWREAWGTIRQFLTTAIPVFALICVAASLLAKLGILQIMSSCLGPLMACFRLPADAALPVILSSIRKDGIFLFASGDGLSMPMSSIQVLTAVYLAGVLLPCLVTAWTIARETSIKTAIALVSKQAAFAIGFAILLAWFGALLG